MRHFLPAAVVVALVSGAPLAQEPDAGTGVAGLPEQMEITAALPAARAEFSRGRALYYNLRTAEARKAFAEAARLDPGCPLAHVYLALTTKPVTAGREHIERAQKLKGKMSAGEQLLVDAVAAQIRGDVAEEDSKREALVTMFPKDWRVLVGRGNRLFHLGKYPQAIEYLERAVKVAPDEAAPYNDLGYTYAYAGRLDDAIRALKQYAERLPSEPNPHDSLAEILLKAGKIREAISEYEKAIAIDASFVLANEGLGHGRLLSGDFEGAREAYRRYSDGAATSWERLAGLDWIAASYTHEGRLDDAVRQLDQADALATTLKEPAWNALFAGRKALALLELGRRKEALAAGEAAVKAASKPGLPPALQAELQVRAQLCRGAVLARTGDVAGARKAEVALAGLVRPKGLKGDPDPKLEGLAQVLHAFVVAELPAEEAKKETVATTGLDADPWGLAIVADALERQGKTTEANELRQRALRVNLPTPEWGLVRPRLLAGSADKNARFGSMPITTSSTAALALFTDARRIGEAYRRSIAVAALEKAVELDPEFALARCYVSIFTESPEEGAEHLKKAAAIAAAGKVSDGERLFVEAHFAAANGDQEGKEKKLEELARLYPNDWRPMAYLGEHLFRMNRRAAAIEKLTEAAKRDPDEPYPYNGLGYAHALEGKFEEGIKALKRYVELSPGESNPHDSLAEVLMLAGKPAEAEAEFRRSLELSPQFVASYAGLGHARLFAGNPAGAREAYRQMADRSSLAMDRVAAQTWSALTWAWEERFLDAASSLARAEVDAETAKDRLGAALLAARRIPMMAEAGRAADGIALADYVLKKTRGKLSPAAQGMVEREAIFGRGWAELLADKHAAVEASAAELAAIAKRLGNPDAATLSAALSAALALARGKPADAVALLEPADRHHPLVQVLLAESYEQNKQPAKAKPLREALDQPSSNHLVLAVARHRQRQLAR